MTQPILKRRIYTGPAFERRQPPPDYLAVQHCERDDMREARAVVWAVVFTSAAWGLVAGLLWWFW